MKFAIYNRETGRIVGHFTGSLSALRLNVPDGHGAVPGEFDPLSQRIDDATGEPVDWQPPQPSQDHEWNEDSRRWLRRTEVVDRELKRQDALSRISELERRQLRALREQALGRNGAVERLDNIDREIERLRTYLT